MFLLYELMVALCMGLGICGALTGLAHYVLLEGAHIMHHEQILTAAQASVGGLQRGSPWRVQSTSYDVAYTWQGNQLVIAPVTQHNTNTVRKVTVSDVHGYTLFLLSPW